jgi:hypothetical protein
MTTLLCGFKLASFWFKFFSVSANYYNSKFTELFWGWNQLSYVKHTIMYNGYLSIYLSVCLSIYLSIYFTIYSELDYIFIHYYLISHIFLNNICKSQYMSFTCLKTKTKNGIKQTKSWPIFAFYLFSVLTHFSVDLSCFQGCSYFNAMLSCCRSPRLLKKFNFSFKTEETPATKPGKNCVIH